MSKGFLRIQKALVAVWEPRFRWEHFPLSLQRTNLAGVLVAARREYCNKELVASWPINTLQKWRRFCADCSMPWIRLRKNRVIDFFFHSLENRQSSRNKKSSVSAIIQSLGAIGSTVDGWTAASTWCPAWNLYPGYIQGEQFFHPSMEWQTVTRSVVLAIIVNHSDPSDRIVISLNNLDWWFKTNKFFMQLRWWLYAIGWCNVWSILIGLGSR